MNTQAVRTAPRSPWQDAYVERVIGSIRRECLDHVIVMNAAGLHRMITNYVAYYMRSRTHLALGRTHRSRDRSHCRWMDALSPRQTSAVCTTVTTASPHSRPHDVGPSYSPA